VPYSKWLAVGCTAVLALAVAACGADDDGGSAATTTQAEQLAGSIRIDGSSTVFPFAEAAAELFNEDQPNVKITVGQSGTGGGFEKFCAGETDISDASRAIEDDEEAACEKANVAFSEVQVANDGIAVAANKGLEVACLTTGQLKKIWNKGSKVNALSDIDPKLPDTELSLYGPGTDSGTFDFFTAEINGEEGATREDYEASEDDNQLVTGVTGDEGGFGYFGFSYAQGRENELNLVAVNAGNGCVTPSGETIQSGEYKPLARPLLMYPSASALKRPEVKAFMDFVLENQADIAEVAKIVAMTDAQAGKATQALQAAEAAS
jgi:phosphate transport system substrate-binding protein